jgi:hypothetical protein
MVQKLLSEWRVRAIGAGYIQDIHPDELEFLVYVKDEADTATPRHTETVDAEAARLLPAVTRGTAAHASV